MLLAALLLFFMFGQLITQTFKMLNVLCFYRLRNSKAEHFFTVTLKPKVVTDGLITNSDHGLLKNLAVNGPSLFVSHSVEEQVKVLWY